MKISKKDTDSPTPDLMDRAAAFSNHEYTIRGEKIVFRFCPFCEEDHGPRYASGYVSSWYMGGQDPGGFSCKKCGEVAGPYLMFKQLGVEIESAKRSHSQQRLMKALGVTPETKITSVGVGMVEKMHNRSIALLMDEDGAPARDYLESRKILPDLDDYVMLPLERKTIGGWRYKDGSIGIAWWYFDVRTKKPILAKFRAADARAKGPWKKLGKWPSGVDDIPCYREHLYDPQLGEVLICEGEADAESWAVVRIPNVISLPDGAGSADAVWDVLATARSVHLSTDYDAAGAEGSHKIESLLGSDATVFRVRLESNSGHFYKDANDALQVEGEDFLYDAYSKALVTGEPGLRMRRPYVKTGFASWDARYFGLRLGGYTHIFGGAGQGKTTWAWSLLLNLRLQGTICSYVSLEEPCSDICTDMAASMEGLSRGTLIKMEMDNDPMFAEAEKRVESKYQSLVRVIKFFGCGQEWPDSVVPSYKRMIETIGQAAKFGSKVVVVDNFSIMRNTLTAPTKNRRQQMLTDYAAASRVAQDMLSLAKQNNIHIILLNHVSGSGSAYGKSRLDPLAELSFKCKRQGDSTLLSNAKLRVSSGGKPLSLRYRMSSNGTLVDAGLVEEAKKKKQPWDQENPRGDGNF